MAQCPICKTPGAYIGFFTVECRNPDCEHFALFEEPVCPCCGQVGHNPEVHVLSGGDPSPSVSPADSLGTIYLDYVDPDCEPASTVPGSSGSFDGPTP